MPRLSGDKPVDAMQPEIIETGGVPELFSDTIVVKTFGETVRLYLGRALTPAGGNAEVVCIVHMPVGGFVTALRLMATEYLVKPDAN